MLVAILEQKKWPGHSSQGRLFPRPEPASMPVKTARAKSVEKPVGNPVENVKNGLVLDRPDLSGPVPAFWPLKDLKKVTRLNNKNAQPAISDAVEPEDNADFLARLRSIARAKAIDTRPAMTDQELDARRRFLLGQLEQIRRQQKAS
jgi:hypothetical protein